MNKANFTFKHMMAVLVLFFILGGFFGATFFRKTVVVREGTADTEAAMTSVNLMIDYGTGTIKTWNTVSWHESMSVLNLMETVAGANAVTIQTKDGTDGNPLLNAVDGVMNSATKRWQFWVNNNYEPTIASKYFLKPGDLVVMKFADEQK